MKRSSQGAPAALAREQLPQPPERQRIEAGDDQLAFGHQHALGLAQHEVRIGGGFERMRQHDQVHALVRERQLHRIGGKRGAVLEREREAERNAVGAQEIDLVQAHLHRAVAEHVLGREVELGQLPVEHVAGPAAWQTTPRARAAPRYTDARHSMRRIAGPCSRSFRYPLSRTTISGRCATASNAAVVDPGEARPVQDYLAREGLHAGRDPRHAPPSRSRRRHRRTGRA